MGSPRSHRHLPLMTPMEGRGLTRGGILLLILATVRLGLERGRSPGPPPEEGSGELDRLLEEARAERDEELRRSLPLAPGETIDPNRAGEVELDRLPGVGPVAARAIVDERVERGAFTGPEDLLRVRGIGPGTLAKIRPWLDFSEGRPVALRPAVAQDRIDVNRAPAEDLQRLPGIGPALAGRIVESRGREGPFRTPEDLLRVRGIGPVVLDRIRNRIQVGG